MILDVRLDRFLPADARSRFEAGTPPIAEADRPRRRGPLPRGRRDGPRPGPRPRLTRYALGGWPTGSATGCRVFGPPAGDDRGGVLSLAFRDVHAHDLAQVLDQFGVCVRPGHHCAKPLMRKLGVPATARASFGLYYGEATSTSCSTGSTEAGMFG